MGSISDVCKLEKKVLWTIRKYAGHEDDVRAGKLSPYEICKFEGNELLNEGIGELLLFVSGTGSPTAWSNAAAYLGVGDSSTAHAASQTGLQASTNKLYKAMETSYPTVASQMITWRSVFGSTDANFAWAEFSVSNTNSDTGKNLNRKVSAQGTKTAGQTWTLDLAITFA